ncbi:hypothetical protein [Chryseobacterium sp.]|uniref:hypothetical protein n=1 Tax=Chryseobacterium sp. TaxID=1871047 RepID=UPI0028A217B3|nr:hypothetical protein [Chryseobacterium sp.]
MKITIPKPCHENWNSMTTEEKGRFCAVCSKTVRDFTTASDEEIINTFSSSSEKNICGYFNESQLNIDLQYSYINSLFVRFAVGFMLTTGGFMAVNAQENKTQDTLKAEKLDEVVLTGLKTVRHTMVLGKPAVMTVDENKLQQIKNDSPKNKSIRIGGAIGTLKEDQQPILILDGKVTSLEELRKIDSQLIESVNILKDKKAKALYGEDGKNGVVLVTTKKK